MTTFFTVVFIVFILLQIVLALLENSYRVADRKLRYKEYRAKKDLANELRRFNNSVEELREERKGWD